MCRVVQLIVLAITLTGSSTAQTPSTAQRPARIEVSVTLRPDGDWTVEYRVPRSAAEWKFERSQPAFDGGSWRAGTYLPETAGVRLVSEGGDDRLVVENPGLTTFRLRVKPYSGPLRGDNQPTVRFSNGAVAIYPGQFIIGTDAFGDMPIETRLTVKAPGSPILAGGRRFQSLAVVPMTEETSYVVVGGRAAVVSSDVASVIDPGLPEWISRELDTFVPRLLHFYGKRLGKPAVGRPTVLAAWGGTRPGSSFSGSVFTDMVAVDLAGSKLAQPDAAIRRRILFFLAHETAHFWMGNTLRHANRRDSWISEGAAEAMAVEALVALDPGHDREAERRSLVDECASKLPARVSLQTLAERGGDRAAYACGAAMYFTAAGNRSVLEVVARLLGENRRNIPLSGDQWLSQISATWITPQQKTTMGRLIHDGFVDPQDIRKL